MGPTLQRMVPELEVVVSLAHACIGSATALLLHLMTWTDAFPMVGSRAGDDMRLFLDILLRVVAVLGSAARPRKGSPLKKCHRPPTVEEALVTELLHQTGAQV